MSDDPILTPESAAGQESTGSKTVKFRTRENPSAKQRHTSGAPPHPEEPTVISQRDIEILVHSRRAYLTAKRDYELNREQIRSALFEFAPVEEGPRFVELQICRSCQESLFSCPHSKLVFG